MPRVHPFGSAGLTVASYNVHRCIGSDGRHDIDRTVAVLEELGADIVALQEIDGQSWPALDAWSQEAGFASVLGFSPTRRHGQYGNILLTRCPVLGASRIDLSVAAFEPRGALDVSVSMNGRAVRVVSSHFGLFAWERWKQAKRLVGAMKAGRSDPVLLLGDFNGWLPFDASIRLFHARFGRSPSAPSFPARFPVLALDRIWCQPRKALRDLRVHTTPLSRIASDHLPVIALCDPAVLAGSS
jgi:endonuclease/exonuclease/phosphatase family metal-dependent hydrolase